MNIFNHKKTILIITLVLVAFFGYWYVFVSKKDTAIKNDGQVVNKNVKAQTSVSNTPYDKEFVSSLVTLNPIKLDISLLESPVYKALNYPEKPFEINYPTDSGRNNPFLPIGIDILSVDAPTSLQNKTNVIPVNTDKPVATTTIPKTQTIPKPTPKTF